MKRSPIMKKLLVIITVAVAVTIGFASTADQARAIDGSSSTLTCPQYKPYVHVNAFGMAYCSVYP
jgi:hypothetical protein